MDLDSVGIATSCPASWEDMKGDARVRFCGSCMLHVYNLSEMRRQEAEALVREKEGRLCVRFYRRPDGTLLTKDCGLIVRARRRAAWAWGAGVAALLALTAWAGSLLPGFGPALSGRFKRTPAAVIKGPGPTRPVPLMGEAVAQPDVIMGKLSEIPQSPPP